MRSIRKWENKQNKGLVHGEDSCRHSTNVPSGFKVKGIFSFLHLYSCCSCVVTFSCWEMLRYWWSLEKTRRAWQHGKTQTWRNTCDIMMLLVPYLAAPLQRHPRQEPPKLLTIQRTPNHFEQQNNGKRTIFLPSFEKATTYAYEL